MSSLIRTKVLIITQRDPFFIDTFLYEFQRLNINCKVLNLPNFGKSFWWGLKRAKDLYGFYGLIKLVIKALIYKFSRKFTIDIIDIDSVEDITDYEDFIGDGDVLLSLSAPNRIPVEKLKFTGKKLNIHCGKLPEYAGMMPIFWQLNDNLRSITVTLQELGEDIDKGNLISETLIPFNQSLFQTSIDAKCQSAFIIKEYITKLEDNSINSLKKNPHTEHLRKFPSKEEILCFKQRVKLI